MWIDKHPYFSIYLLGSALFVILAMLNMVLEWLLDWITKDNILQANLKKLQPSDETSQMGVLGHIVIIIFEAALSWINVIVAIWRIAKNVMYSLRYFLASKPEEIKSLEFPLRNNPDMSREAVWAHSLALGVKGGGNKYPDGSELLNFLNNAREELPSFDRAKALHYLEGLNIVNAGVITSVRQRILSSDSAEEEKSIQSKPSITHETFFLKIQRLIIFPSGTLTKIGDGDALAGLWIIIETLAFIGMNIWFWGFSKK
jgi:hypothetical protein